MKVKIAEQDVCLVQATLKKILRYGFRDVVCGMQGWFVICQYYVLAYVLLLFLLLLKCPKKNNLREKGYILVHSLRCLFAANWLCCLQGSDNVETI